MKFYVDLKKSMSQGKKILDYIRKYGHISSYEACTKLGITSLHRRITDLEKKGYVFDKKWRYKTGKDGKVINKYKEYSITD